MIRSLLFAIAGLVTLASCSGNGSSGSLPFTRSPLDSGSATLWSVDLHIADHPGIAMLQDIRNRLHADMIRIYYDPTAGNAFYDTLAANAAATGLKIAFVTPYPVPPYDPVAYGHAAGIAAARYAGQHVLWELINEPDFYVPGMSEAQCISVEIAAANAIRAADRSAKIVTGGTSGQDSNQEFRYLKALGTALAPYVDGVGLHPYGVAPSAFASEAAIVSLITGRPTYITEWATTSATDLQQAMVSSSGNTPMFDAYEYQNQPGGDPGYGLIDNGLWVTFAAQASP